MYMKVLAAQLCQSVCNPMGYSLPGSSVHRILPSRILEWVAIPFSRGSSWPRDQTWVSCIAGRFFTAEPAGKPVYVYPPIFVCFGFSGSSLLCGLSLVAEIWGCSPGAMCGLLTAVAFCRARALGYAGFGSCGFWALEHRLNSCGSWA